MAYIGEGSAGQVLQAVGTTGSSKYSTATYPVTAGTSGKILISDGTNIISSTPTYPNSAGTSGNILQSDGTNFVSTAGSGLLVASNTLTNSQIKNLHATPIDAIGPPGSGKVIVPLIVSMKMNYGGTNVFTAPVGINLTYGTATIIFTGVLANAQIVAAATQFASTIPGGQQAGANTLFDNISVKFFNPSGTEIAGNAANNNTITWSIIYQIVSI